MRLSIIIPSYQQGGYIGRTLQSIVEQTGNFETEIFVVDGGSTDETLDVIRKYENRITWWRSHKDDGQTAAINEGLTHASGDVIAYINSDDFYLPHAFQTVAEWWNSRSANSPLWLAGAGRFEDEDTHSCNVVKPSRPPRDPALLLGHPWCPPQPSSFWAHELFRKLGAFDPILRYVMDVEWSVRCELSGFPPSLTDKVLSVRWLHSGAKSASKARFFTEMAQVVRRLPAVDEQTTKVAFKFLKNREEWDDAWWAKFRIGRLAKDFFSYPPVAAHWASSLFR